MMEKGISFKSKTAQKVKKIKSKSPQKVNTK